ncbi:LexA family transcriptional regulator [Burkholderia vietnamiensis]|uniref:LexA family transcriptional regulator n=1 Tax=Burkholderia vietnamiensis TaxID=60552 RepID=UPI001593985F|nr:LexA family transcriptional regulator [Burkholderia vietnamiensis]
MKIMRQGGGDDIGLAMRLAQKRNDAKLTQQELADRIGIAARNVSLYENGHARPRGETIRKLAAALACDPYWLATGKNADTQKYLADSYHATRAIMPTLTSVLIEDWDTLSDETPKFLPHFTLNPTAPNHSSDPGLFAHLVATTFSQFRATRYPGTRCENVEYPPGTVIVFDAGPTSAETLRNGDVVIYRLADEVGAPGLRRVARENAAREIMLVSLNPAMPPIEFDELDTRIIGVVVSRCVTNII